MSNTQAEPSMDEILASIRRIISEEDEPAASESSANSAASDPLTLTDSVEATQEAEPSPDPVDDFSEPVEAVASPEAEPADEIAAAPPQATTPTKEEAPMPAAPKQEESPVAKPAIADSVSAALGAEGNLVSGTAASLATSAFNALEHNVRVSNGNGRTIEDVIEAMLAPMLQEWLDTNLPRIVEDKVEEEVRRIARRR